MRSAAFLVASLALCLAGCSKKEEPPPPAPAVADDYPGFDFTEMPPSANYPLKKCCVCDTEFASLGHKPKVFAYRMYEVQVCDMSCMKTFGKDPEGYIKTKINPRAIFDK